jgi:DNA-binding MarR family transcriptional regulator
VTGPDPAELAGGLRVAALRLAYALRRPGSTPDLTPSRYTALTTLEKRGSLRPGDLAEAMAIAKPTLSRLLEALTAGGWIVREVDPDDRRASLVGLSARGHDVLDRIRREATTALRDDIDALSADQQRVLAAALPVLVEVAERQLARAGERVDR